MTIRLSTSSLAGTVRTEVAVGTANDASMLATTRAAGPRRTVEPASTSSAWWTGASVRRSIRSASERVDAGSPSGGTARGVLPAGAGPSGAVGVVVTGVVEVSRPTAVGVRWLDGVAAGEAVLVSAAGASAAVAAGTGAAGAAAAPLGAAASGGEPLPDAPPGCSVK